MTTETPRKRHRADVSNAIDGGPSASLKRSRENKEVASLSSEVHYENRSRRDRDRDLYADRDDDDDPPSKPRNFGSVRFGGWVLDTWFYSPYPLIDERPPIPSSSNSQALPPARRGTPTLPPHPSSSGISKPLITTLPRAPNIPFSELTTAATPASTLVQEEKAHHTVRGARGRFVPLNPETTSSRTTRDLLSITAKSPPAGETLSLDAEPATNSKGGVGEKVKDKMLWVCDGCFKYLRTLAGYTNHTSTCKVDHPPGKKVYEKGSYSIWEVEGNSQKLYCQNLSLFGKLFIDHKTIFFDVDNFLFYVLTENMYKREHAIGFFSKEIVSSEDFNLACIVAFPQYQGRGYGKMLMEFSYYLTRHADSPGTPERPLSELGAIGYESFWIKNVLRSLLVIVLDGVEKAHRPELQDWARTANEVLKRKLASGGFLSYTDFAPPTLLLEQGSTPVTQTVTLKQLSKLAHVRQDDVVFVLESLGMLASNRPAEAYGASDLSTSARKGLGKWHGLEIVVSLDTVLRGCEKWKVRGKGILDEKACKI
ncbi:hypothetical protein FFLO_03201 [Filobasidium floriforme]|uniref:histone acetyltransferase n=1 Tax=Filobasidium floriforme TaxID=5210 RepID=A0A8K0NR24_9TREE|nr:hypothetical protein FFLO_03201 [Filobasidium floriforme]